MNISSGHPFEYIIVFLSEKGQRANPGSKLVTHSRVTNISSLTICDTNRQFPIETFKKIGKGNIYNNMKKIDHVFLSLVAIPKNTLQN